MRARAAVALCSHSRTRTRPLSLPRSRSCYHSRSCYRSRYSCCYRYSYRYSCCSRYFYRYSCCSRYFYRHRHRSRYFYRHHRYFYRHRRHHCYRPFKLTPPTRYTPGELYRANVPLFFPSRNLTFEWECSHGVLNERTSNSELCYAMGWCKRPATSVWLPEPVRGPYDPQAGCAHDAASVRHWLGLVDWVQPYMREVVLFDSIDDLVFKLETTDLGAVSARMAAHNAELRAAAHEAWGGVLDRVLAAPRGEAVPVSEVPDTGFYADCAVTLFEGAALRLRPHHVGPGGVELWDMNRTGDDPQAYSRALPHTIRVRMDVMIDQSAAAAADISSAAADLLFGVVACLYDSNFTVCTEFDSGPPVQTAIPASTQDSSMLSGDTLEYDAYFPVETYGHHTVESYFCELGRGARTRMDMMFVEPPGGDAAEER